LAANPNRARGTVDLGLIVENSKRVRKDSKRYPGYSRVYPEGIQSVSRVETVGGSFSNRACVWASEDLTGTHKKSWRISSLNSLT